MHSVMQFGSDDINIVRTRVQKNLENAKRVVIASGIYKYSFGQNVDICKNEIIVKAEARAACEALRRLSKRAMLS